VKRAASLFALWALWAGGLAHSAPATPSPKGATVERVVAVVDGDVILSSELEERVAPVLTALAQEDGGRGEDGLPAPDKEQRAAQIRQEALDRMVDEELLMAQARQLKLTVTGADVDKAIDEVKKNNHLGDDQLIEALRQQGYTYASYRQDLRRQIIRLKVLQVAVRPRVSVSDEEVQTFYNDSVRGLSEGASAKVHARHIFIEVPEGGPKALVAARRKQAEELMVRARAGEDFADLARRYSQDPATKEDGGDLGIFGRGVLPKELEDVVFSLQPGEVRGPIVTPQGLHIVRMIERVGQGARPLGEVKEQIRNQLYQQELEKQTRLWLQELRKKSHVETRL
jgi:parvulin-like peptidyl-prolyl isomerase